MKSNIKIFSTPEKVAEVLANDLYSMINLQLKTNNYYSFAISGGNTPKLLFSELAKQKLNWECIHYYWTDERCVPPDSKESNYGMSKQYLLDKINIPEENIHRIKGEDDPEKEAERYSQEILNNISLRDGLPMFDCILLGVGDDGHTASIFPNQKQLLNSNKICEIAYNPQNNQKRITLTGKIINNSASIIFLVIGRNKANIISEIIINKNTNYPAAHINPSFGELYWYLDKFAAMQLNNNNL